MSNLIIAVDGPAGAGKSTIAKIVSEKLNINYIDTGAMYRAVTYKCLKNNIDVNNEKEVIKIAKNSDIDFENNNIYLDQKIINNEIRTIEVSNNVSNVAKIKEVRKLMVEVQRKIGTKSSVILDGRDIGSYVFPNADYKFFLVATPEERGSRRYKELCNKGYNTTLKEVIEDIVKRDEIDSNREFAPLVKAEDALEIDTTGKTIDQVVQEVVSKISF
ncbi:MULTISPECIES: (d)CMP kinase [unclassified Clostridioides]|uniref:(d)CMP kinase n=1 Tax=unclassified Clostridioides TaxID=2635829 RepID=UPI001D0C85D1|nr:(d)CMP kinase [Clostridioides sp. ES-S-0001-02]MCC0642270.1 (d)CMP kinase [Clostridioides sp. ES-S-0049-03]MCC0671273.1 (d)CMP kinase [Clostridioides sp. ES-S-0145-01]MCC0674919.1 (d)CMP kinase [Clostridioides sp. ES-W-0018-02]MCC0679450.1 (d)CMP kinase [Clostridioides sp. ES-S-0005-03]MCC0702393.1 (d)CMP kinase [Clostridioides sp. ES-S-0049-02]MCC0706898.1 (d)CMP kinase [Clostridioides sp. ES-S-0190-01]MCC0710267.1 (d)CMP kinase [Clostridioides sp. ES-W-0017-02]MCC0764350.1 (d)CMP kinas